MTRSDLEARLITKAWKDPDFRKEVVNDPKGMLEKYLGQKLPGGIKIFVHEEDANTLHMSIPPAPSNVTELSDEDLAKVAGGTDIVTTIVTVIATIGLTAAATLGGAVIVGDLDPTKAW